MRWPSAPSSIKLLHEKLIRVIFISCSADFGAYVSPRAGVVIPSASVPAAVCCPSLSKGSHRLHNNKSGLSNSYLQLITMTLFNQYNDTWAHKKTNN